MLLFLLTGGAIGKYVTGWLGERYGPIQLIWGTKGLTAALLLAASATPVLAMAPLMLVLGIGLNVGFDPNQSVETAGLATSLESATGRRIPREEVLRQLLQDLDSLYLKLQHGQSPLIQWREMLETLGRNVRVSWSDGGGSQTGIAEDIDDIGNLLLRLDGGELITVTAGDVTLAPPRS